MVFFLCLHFDKQFMDCCKEAPEISNSAKGKKRGKLKPLNTVHFQNLQILTKISQYISQNKSCVHHGSRW